MSLYDLLFLLVIAAGAFYAGYQTGRASMLTAERDAEASPPGSDPLPGPSSFPSRPRGETMGDATPAGPGPGGMPRRSTKPPPAAAGLLDKGGKEKH